MKILMRSIYVTLVLCACACGILQAQKPDTSARARYDAMLQRVKHNDTSVNFTAMRHLLSDIDPAAVTGAILLHKPILAALNTRDMKRVYETAMEAIAKNYLDVRAHILASVAAKELGYDSAWVHHRYVFRGIITSILNSGDGKSPETAYEVISVDEEYAVLSALGMESHGQKLDHGAGHALDILSAKDPETKAERKIYFNADLVLANERRALEK